MRRIPGLRELGAAALGFFLFTSYALGPVWSLLGTHLTPNLGDSLFNLVVLDWGHHQLTGGSGRVWDLPIYHPLDSTLLLSDHLLGTVLLTWPVHALVGSVVTYNLLFFSSFWLSALTTYGVTRAGGLSPAACAIAGLAFAFSPFRWMHAGHLQILLMAWIPLLLFSFDRLLARPRGRTAALFLATYTLHLTGGAYLAYLVHLPLATLALHRGLSRDSSGQRGWLRWRSRRAWPWLAVTAVLVLTLLAAMFLPYRASPLDLERHEADYRTYGVTLPSLVTPSPESPHFPWLRPLLNKVTVAYGPGLWHAEKALFPGIVALLLGWVGIRTFLRRQRPPTPEGPPPPRTGTLLTAFAVAVAVAVFLVADLYTWAFRLPAEPDEWLEPGRFYDLAFMLMAGSILTAWVSHRVGQRGRDLPRARRRPAWPTESMWLRGFLLAGAVSLLAGFPVIFEPLTDRVPGLAAMRVPARLAVFPSFVLAVFAGRGWDHLTVRALQWRSVHPVAASMALLPLLLAPLALAVESLPRGLTWHPVPDLPPAHRWIAQRPEVEVYLELPFGQHWSQETRYMHHLTHHWKPTVNGYSGHRPETYRQLRAVCCWPVPDERALTLLRHFGVSHIVIHRAELHRPWARRALDAWIDEIEAGRLAEMRLVYRDERGDVIVALNGSQEADHHGRK